MPWHYVDRTVEPVLRQSARHFPALALTGPRQSGKTTVLRHAFPGHEFISLDDPVRRQAAIDDPQLLLGTNAGMIVLDEIQYVPELLTHIKLAIDNDRQAMGRYLLTGSQQFPLIKGLGDSLSGRVAVVELLPFDRAEMLRACDSQPATADDFVGACLGGSYPELALDPRRNRDMWYASYIQTYLERDIRTIYNIGDLREFLRTLRLLASRCSQQLNYSTVAAEIGVSVNTIKRWVSILEAGRVVYLLEPFFRNFGKRIVKSPKLYFTDCGLVCYLTGISDRKHLLQGPMAGALFENYCVQETLKVFQNAGKQPRMYYLRVHGGAEIDLIVEGPAQRLFPCECKLTSTPNAAMGASLAAAMKTMRDVQMANGAVVCRCDTPIPLSGRTTALPVGDFLSGVKTFLAGD